MFHLGEEMLVRLPSAEAYVPQVEKEQLWLPRLAPSLPVKIPEPIAMGEPGAGYPWKWSIYRWIAGESAATGNIDSLEGLAEDLGGFLAKFQAIDASEGPTPGSENFHRGGSLSVYQEDAIKAIHSIRGRIDDKRALRIWEEALSSEWNRAPVWVHGDISRGNLLLEKGKLVAVIDFGQMAVGDPACDLAIAWTLFKGHSREVFREKLQLDNETWARGKGWTLWKAAVTAAGFTDPQNTESARCWEILRELI